MWQREIKKYKERHKSERQRWVGETGRERKKKVRQREIRKYKERHKSERQRKRHINRDRLKYIDGGTETLKEI